LIDVIGHFSQGRVKTIGPVISKSNENSAKTYFFISYPESTIVITLSLTFLLLEIDDEEVTDRKRQHDETMMRSLFKSCILAQITMMRSDFLKKEF
jgi:hypothetical protein